MKRNTRRYCGSNTGSQSARICTEGPVSFGLTPDLVLDMVRVSVKIEGCLCPSDLY
jgi:hypothetical protein